MNADTDSVCLEFQESFKPTIITMHKMLTNFIFYINLYTYYRELKQFHPVS